jgi:hypothetical protein
MWLKYLIYLRCLTQLTAQNFVQCNQHESFKTYTHIPMFATYVMVN